MERGGAEDSKPIIGPRCKMKVGGCVFQTDCRLGVDEKQVLVGVRSDYRALLTSFDLNLIDFKRASTAADLGFGDGCLQHVGAVQSDARLSSLSVSRHIAGECVVATYDDRVYLWDAARQTGGGSALSSLQKVGVDLGGCGDDGPCANRMPMQVKFGAHPRQLFVATDRQVALVDLRTGSNSRARKLFTSPGSARERVSAMLAGVDFDQDSEFTCVVATDRNLQLFDLRHCKLPLLKWALNLRQPCRYLASTTCHQQRHEATSLLIAANSQQIHCHGFATTSSCRPRHPPVSLGPPRKLAATHHVHRALARLSPALRRAARKRLTQPMVGVAALTSGDAATVVVHVTAAGDLFYQTVALTTGDDATRQDANGEESARAAYEEWARAAVAGEVEVVAGEISHPQSELLDAVTSSIRGAAVAAHCGACDDARCSPFDDDSRGDASPADGDAPCAKCGLAVGAASNLQRCRHHSRPFVRDSLRRASSFWPDDDGDDGDELQLIDMARTEGLGHVLVATWTGAYEDVWAEMRVKEEEKKAELEQSLFDLRQQPPVADSPAPLIFCGEIGQSSVTSLPPNGGSSGHVIEPVRMTTTFTKAERASSPPAADWTEPKLERDVGERMTSFRHSPANVTSFHHSPAYMTSFHHSPTNMTSFHHSPAKKMKLVKNSLKREDEGKFPSPNGSRRRTATPTVRKRNNNVGF